MIATHNEPAARLDTGHMAGIGHAKVAPLASPEFNDIRRALANFCKPRNIDALREAMASEGLYEPAWQSASRVLCVDWDSLPAHLNIEVKGELGFLVERRVWQSAIFAAFVVRNVNPTFGRGAVVSWCRATLGMRNDFALLQQSKHLLPREENKALPWAPRAIRAYLRALVKRGFLASRGGGRYEILRRQFGSSHT